MRPFNLEQALSGEPVMLRCGGKAIVKYRLEDELIRQKDNIAGRAGFPQLHGFVLAGDGKVFDVDSWFLNGKNNPVHDDCDCSDCLGDFDIVGMWEEPQKYPLP